MFCVRCRRLFWRDPKPVRAADRPKQNTRRPQGDGKDPKQCPGDEETWERDQKEGGKLGSRATEERLGIVQGCNRCETGQTTGWCPSRCRTAWLR
jgi:hypothetical protein